MESGILQDRLRAHSISRSRASTPIEVVKALGAVQSQDYEASLWAIGLRCGRKVTRTDVEDSIRKREITRTWLLRGTLHMSASEDIMWMIEPTRLRLRGIAEKRDKHLGLGPAIVEKAINAMEKALRGGKILTREEMYRIMVEMGVPTGNNLGYHMLYRAAWDGLICMGPQQGKEQTFVLLDEWVKRFRSPGKEEILRDMAISYFSGHGPATIRDFAWWSGLKASEARDGVKMAGKMLKKFDLNGNIYHTYSTPGSSVDDCGAILLPAFDEYVLGYSDRSLLTGESSGGKGGSVATSKYIHRNGVFLPTLLWNGKVMGTWKKQRSGKGVKVSVHPFAEPEREKIEGIQESAALYGEFLEKEVQLKIEF